MFSPAPVDVSVPADLVPAIEHILGIWQEAQSRFDARGLEKLVHQELSQADQLVMEAFIRAASRQEAADDVREVSCLHCGEWATLLDESRKRTMITVDGTVRFTRRVYQCANRACRRERAPLDEQLGLKPRQHLSPLVRKKVAWAGAMQSSYEKAAEDMEHQAEIPVSAKQVQRVTNAVGEQALALQNEEVKRFGRPAAWNQIIEPEERPETLVVEMDGTCVMGRDGEGHEVKCATVFGLDARARTGSPGKERPVLLRRAYCATSRGIESFRSMVWSLCVSWGIRSASRVVVIGDGIDWLWNLSADRFHFHLVNGETLAPIEILDFYHAAENLTKARNAIFQKPEGSPAKRWYEHWRHRIREGKVEELISELKRRARQASSNDNRQELQRRAAYFSKHAHRMNYPEYKACGFPIGSGAIEGTCKNLVKGRMACVGQRWGIEEGVEHITALRVQIFNHRYDDLWKDPVEQLAA